MQFTDDNGNITVKIKGMLDTATAISVDAELRSELGKVANVNSITIDASEMTFISSSGLRIMLTLRKMYPRFKITEVQADVYNIFEMTGFTKMMDITKALRKKNVDGCPEIGRGGVGIVFRTGPDEITKVFREGTSLEEVTKEISMAKESFVLGMPTAISFDIVKVGNCYGLVYELLNATTLAEAISRNPDKLEEYAVEFAHMTRELHSIEVKTDSIIPNGHDNEEKAICKISKYFDSETTDNLKHILHSIPQGHSLLHCDLHPKNVMLQGSELLFIDMGEVSYGNPLLDLGHTYSSLVGLVGDYQTIVGFPEETSHRFFDLFIREYYAGESEATIRENIEMIKIVSFMRNLTWLALSDSFPEEVINSCRKVYKERIADNIDYVNEVCEKIKNTEKTDTL